MRKKNCDCDKLKHFFFLYPINVSVTLLMVWFNRGKNAKTTEDLKQKSSLFNDLCVCAVFLFKAKLKGNTANDFDAVCVGLSGT